MKNEDVKNFLVDISEKIKHASFNRNGFKYHSLEEFVLKNGQSFEISNKKVKQHKMKECFRNAFILADDNNYTYVEGYATFSGIGFPVLHAWCLDEEGKVVDPTWDHGDEYYGVPFEMNYVRKIIMKRKVYGVIDNWENRWPLLKGDKEFEDVEKHN